MYRLVKLKDLTYFELLNVPVQYLTVYCNISCRGGHTEHPGQVMFAQGVCGELGNPSIYHRHKRNGEVG